MSIILTTQFNFYSSQQIIKYINTRIYLGIYIN